MCRALDIAVPMYKPLLVSFNKDTLLKTESEKSILTSSKVKNCDEALRTPNVEIMAEGYRTIGKVIAKYAGELEICDCHRTLWNVGAGFKKRRRLMADAIGVRTCIWQGRRLAWFIFVGFSELKRDLRAATSPRMQALLADCDPETRAKITEAFSHMIEELVDIYTAKFDYLFHAPYYAIGAYYCVQGGDGAHAREILKEMFVEIDAVIALGKAGKLDRITRRLWISGAPMRLIAERFILSEDTSLFDYPILFVKLQEYALIPGVSRRIEKLHALIKRQGSHAYGIGVPPQNLERLRTDDEFHRFCLDTMHSRSILDRLLQLRFDRAALKAMTSKAKQDFIYQTGMLSEYGNVDENKAGQAAFLIRTMPQRAEALRIGNGERIVIDYLRDVLAPGQYFTIPKNV